VGHQCCSVDLTGLLPSAICLLGAKSSLQDEPEEVTEKGILPKPYPDTVQFAV
jgi:hypothetical protein